jgi:hypothetical protein
MKLLYLSLLFLLTFVLQNAPDPIDKTAGLLKNGNIEELSKNFASTIYITIKGDENNYSSAQAKLILTNFFDQNPPQGVTILHRITSSSKYNYGVIILTTGGGVYRIAFSLKNNNGKFELTEMSIEAEKTK